MFKPLEFDEAADDDAVDEDDEAEVADDDEKDDGDDDVTAPVAPPLLCILLSTPIRVLNPALESNVLTVDLTALEATKTSRSGMPMSTSVRDLASPATNVTSMLDSNTQALKATFHSTSLGRGKEKRINASKQGTHL
jgi:hypothetical protein